MSILATQDCPVCDEPIELHAPPYRWIHPGGVCASLTYERLCDPDPFASGLADTPAAQQARAKVRGRTRRTLYLNRARGSNAHSPIQALKDETRVEQDAHRSD